MASGTDGSGMIAISHCQIAAHRTQTITTNPDVAVTLWVEKGRIEVLAMLGGHAVAVLESPCAVPLGRGAVHVHNPGKTPAVVFAATAAIGRAVGVEHHPPMLRPTTDLLRPAPPLPTFPGPPTSAVPQGWNLLCSKHGRITSEPVSHDEAVETQDEHIHHHAECKHTTRIRRA
jgi:hypothetical protein